MALPDTLVISELLDGYRNRRFSPAKVMEAVLANIDRAADRRAWITRLTREQVLGFAETLSSCSPESMPLYGVPFAIKDNLDLEGVPTTAGCPDFAYVPQQSAFVVQRLIDAGAVPIGKTNLDQFATGLVGTRSAYGACQNSFDPEYISGGSSSGSAVAVATGLVSFALGTDTAGSGRVPAAFNNLIGVKPTCGALSTRGAVPACRSLDCVSVFALTAEDAALVYGAAAGYDAEDPYSRPLAVRRGGAFQGGSSEAAGKSLVRFGMPRSGQLDFFGDAEYARLFEEAVRRLESLGCRPVEIDFEPFLTAARLLYEGPWVAERYCAVGDFIEHHPASVYPVTRQIIEGGRQASALEAFQSQYRLMELRRITERVWSGIDVLVAPTAGTIYRIGAVDADPIRLNSNLGRYTNFVNLLDLAAVAVPTGFRPDGLPFGVTLVGQAGADLTLLSLASRLQRASATGLGALGVKLPDGPDPLSGNPFEALRSASSGQALAAGTTGPSEPAPPHSAPAGQSSSAPDRISVVVCGAHMEGLPLNHQLTTRGASLLQRARTAPVYRFYALPGGPPHRPGLVRVTDGGASIEVEVWSVPASELGTFLAGIPAPLGLGKVELENGERLTGFICESYATLGAVDITTLGSWRRYHP